LTTKQDAAVAALKVAMGTLDTSKKRAIQGEALCKDTKEDLLKLETQIQDAKKEIVALERQQGAVREQSEIMVNGGGLSS
jgi:hypothetical protein